MKQILSLNRLSIELGVARSVLEDIATNKDKYYDPFLRIEKKRDGTTKERAIDNPNKAIRNIQKRINKTMLRPACEKLPSCMTGSIKGRSIRDNAKPHVGSSALLAVDITDCFPSINAKKVYYIYRIKLECSPPVSKILTKLTTYGDRLPQGAPTSPSLCNLVMEPLVIELSKLAKENNIRFTQYVDDLTFSGTQKTLTDNKRAILKIVEAHGFRVNVKKLRFSHKFERMEITGLVINSFVSVGRKYIRRVEREILQRRSGVKIRGKIAHIQSVSEKRAKKLTRKMDRH